MMLISCVDFNLQQLCYVVLCYVMLCNVTYHMQHQLYICPTGTEPKSRYISLANCTLHYMYIVVSSTRLHIQ